MSLSESNENASAENWLKILRLGLNEHHGDRPYESIVIRQDVTDHVPIWNVPEHWLGR